MVRRGPVCHQKGFRTDSLMWGGVRVSQALALVGSVAAFVILFAVMSKIKKPATRSTSKVFALTPEGPEKIVLEPAGRSQSQSRPQEPSGDTSGGGEEPSPSMGKGKPQD